MELNRERLNAAATATCEHTAASLARGATAEACAALCRGLNRIVDAEVDALKAAGSAVACAPGCAFCCHLRVDVFEHEALALLHHLRTQWPAPMFAAIERRIRANAARVDELGAERHRSARMACALLQEGLCTAHEVRPSACAVYHSLSRARCQQAFRNPPGTGTVTNARPALLELQALGAALIEATQAGCKSAGASSGQTELHQALRALLDGGASAAATAGGGV